jgi:outer membrane biosynthesis protein TonB
MTDKRIVRYSYQPVQGIDLVGGGDVPVAGVVRSPKGTILTSKKSKSSHGATHYDYSPKGRLEPAPPPSRLKLLLLGLAVAGVSTWWFSQVEQLNEIPKPLSALWAQLDSYRQTHFAEKPIAPPVTPITPPPAAPTVVMVQPAAPTPVQPPTPAPPPAVTPPVAATTPTPPPAPPADQPARQMPLDTDALAGQPAPPSVPAAPPEKLETPPATTAPSAAEPPPAPVVPAAETPTASTAGNEAWLELTLQRGDSVSIFFDRHQLSRNDLHKMLKIDKFVSEMRKLQLGQQVRILADKQGNVQALHLLMSDHELHLTRTTDPTGTVDFTVRSHAKPPAPSGTN